MISVISIVNNTSVAKEYLLKSLSRQRAKFQLFLVDNTNNVFKSASRANNVTSLKATGDYFMFIHQDVFLLSRNWFEEVEGLLSTLSKVGLAGVAGMIKPSFPKLSYPYFVLLKKAGMYRSWLIRYGRGNVIHGLDKAPWGGSYIANAVPVQTVDEMLLIVPANVFEHTKFDEITCADWHLHGVDFSLSVTHKGYNVYVLPPPVFHQHSHGSKNSAFFETLAKLVKKHRKEQVINTTTGLYPTSQALGVIGAKIERVPSLSARRFVPKSKSLFLERDRFVDAIKET